MPTGQRMAINSVGALVDLLRRCQLLERNQLEELSSLQVQFSEPRALAKELVRRGWLTPYQANQIFQGHGPDLLLGSYVLLDRLGEGGMGQVFKARQQKLGRVVAVKVIRKERLDNPHAVKRFHREIRAAAQLEHPNIVLALDADQSGATHFFVMEYVEGTDLGKLVKEHGPAPVEKACDYVRQGALGLQHAYERGLVHRDIKPANLLLTPRGSIKILDMGLALLALPSEEESTLTREGTVMGSVDYIAPEQAMNPRDVDIRADLYSLGCTFYYLLTGQAPFPGGSVMEKLLKHRLDEPAPVEQLRPEVPGDVASVVGKLMAKNPDDRYQTPVEAAVALTAAGHAQALTPVPRQSGARPNSGTRIQSAVPAPAGPGAGQEVALGSGTDTASESSFTFSGPPGESASVVSRREHRAKERQRLLVAAVGGGVLLVALAVAGLFAFRKPRPVATEQKPAAAIEVAANKPWHDTGVIVEAGRPITIFVRGQWQKKGKTCPPAGLPNAPRDRAVLPEAPPMCLLARIGDQDRPLVLSAYEKVTPELTGRLFVQANDLDLQENGGSLRLEIEGGVRTDKPAPPPAPTRVEAAERALQPFIAAADDPGNSPEKLGDEIRSFRLKYAGTLQAVHASRLLTKLPSPLDKLRISPGERLDSLPGDVVMVLGEERRRQWGAVRCVGVSGDGSTVASGGDDRVVRLWDVATGKEVGVLAGHTFGVNALALAPGGKIIASASPDTTVKLWDTATKKELASLRGHKSAVFAVAFAANGKTLASASLDKTVRLWDVAGRKELAVFEGHKAMVRAVAFGPGNKLISGGDDRNLIVWDTARPKERTVLEGHTGAVYCLALSPDGRALASAGADATVRLWDVATGKGRASLKGHKQAVQALAFSPDGETLASACLDGTIKLWDLAGGKERATLRGHTSAASSLAFTADGNTLVSGGIDQTVRLWDPATGREKNPLQGPTLSMNAVAFSPDGRLLAAGGGDRIVKVWDTATGREKAAVPVHPGPISAVAFSPDGRTLASCGAYRGVTLWEAATGRRKETLPAPPGNMNAFAFSPDGALLAAGLASKAVKLWDVGTGKEGPTLVGHADQVRAVAFDYAGRTLASAGQDRNAVLWDVTTRDRLATFTGHTGGILALAFAPDGSVLATGGLDYAVKLWDPGRRKEQATLRGHTRAVSGLAFAPDAKTLVSAGDDGLVVWWDVANAARIREWRLPGPVAGVAFAPDGRHVATANANGTVYLIRLEGAGAAAGRADSRRNILPRKPYLDTFGVSKQWRFSHAKVRG